MHINQTSELKYSPILENFQYGFIWHKYSSLLSNFISLSWGILEDPDDVHICIQQEHISITHTHKYVCCKHACIHTFIHIFYAYIYRYILNTYTYASCALISFSTSKVIYLIFKFFKIIIRLHFPFPLFKLFYITFPSPSYSWFPFQFFVCLFVITNCYCIQKNI